MKRRAVSIGLIIITVLGIFLLAGLKMLSLSAARPDSLGVHDGRLAPCPDTPNCVCTQSDNREHWMEPLTIPDQVTDPIRRLAVLVGTMPGAEIVTETNDYLHAEFRSRLFRFCDDVEFLLDPDTNRVHFRSASRVGRSDLGANRARMEQIREIWNQLPSADARAGSAARLRRNSEHNRIAMRP
jgi:uncharacterized protein (DUF1499 family)